MKETLISPGAAVTPSQSAKPRMTLGTSRGPGRTFHFRPALEKSQLGLQHEYINVVDPLSPRHLLLLCGLLKSRLPSKNIRRPSQLHCHVGLCGVYVYRALDTASTREREDKEKKKPSRPTDAKFMTTAATAQCDKPPG